ncbi:MAG: calcium-binding protein, partial [Dehalococcoidia bacterium]|nr:calcium-binding protein [Dehalococcoidia bacterium]
AVRALAHAVQVSPAVAGRQALLVSTALSAGAVAALLATMPPAAAVGVCTVTSQVAACSGTFPNGITYGSNTAHTINVTNAQIGDNAGGEGIELSAESSGVTLTVTTDGNTTIGGTGNYTVAWDGIDVKVAESESSIEDTRIFITNAASITTVGGDGIDAEIDNTSGNNTITINNTGLIISGDEGIVARGNQTHPGSSTAVTITIINEGAITANGNGIVGNATADSHGNGDLSGVSAVAQSPVYNYANITSVGTAIIDSAQSLADAKGIGVQIGGTAQATEIVVNTGNLTSTAGGGIDAKAVASATARKEPIATTLRAFHSIGFLHFRSVFRFSVMPCARVCVVALDRPRLAARETSSSRHAHQRTARRRRFVSDRAARFAPPEDLQASPFEVVGILEQAVEGSVQVLHAVIGKLEDAAADARHDLVDQVFHVEVLPDLPILLRRAEMDLGHHQAAAGLHDAQELLARFPPLVRVLDVLEVHHHVVGFVGNVPGVVVAERSALAADAAPVIEEGVAAVLLDIEGGDHPARADPLPEVLDETAGLERLSDEENPVALPELQQAVDDHLEDDIGLAPHVGQAADEHGLRPALLLGAVEHHLAEAALVDRLQKIPRCHVLRERLSCQSGVAHCLSLRSPSGIRRDHPPTLSASRLCPGEPSVKDMK